MEQTIVKSCQDDVEVILTNLEMGMRGRYMFMIKIQLYATSLKELDT